MRTTVNVESDVAAEVERLRREQGLGLSEALNLLARRGMAVSAQPVARFEQRHFDLGARIDLTNVAEVLDLLEQDSS